MRSLMLVLSLVAPLAWVALQEKWDARWVDYDCRGALWVLDATDLGLIQVVSSWSAPGGHAADGLRYSMHNPRFLDGTLVLAYYHGGVWALDLATQAHR